VLFGDPRFTKGMPFNKGTAKNQGVCQPVYLCCGLPTDFLRCFLGLGVRIASHMLHG
jgi:hypothetical protein